jgi:hypothetical protein
MTTKGKKVRVVSLQDQKGQDFNVTWEDFLSTYHEKFLGCFCPEYFLKSVVIPKPKE